MLCVKSLTKGWLHAEDVGHGHVKFAPSGAQNVPKVFGSTRYAADVTAVRSFCDGLAKCGFAAGAIDKNKNGRHPFFSHGATHPLCEKPRCIARAAWQT